MEPIDLFDEQKKGLPDYYGKKDKQTTEQAWFTCNVCECDLKSVVTAGSLQGDAACQEGAAKEERIQGQGEI